MKKNPLISGVMRSEFSVSIAKCIAWLSLSFFIVLAPQTTRAQESGTGQGTVTGVVSDSAGPLAGASVVIKGTSVGTVTDANGNYSIKASAGSTLVFGFLGRETQEIPVGSRSVIDVLMETDAQIVDELVVIGYGVQKKSLITGAISSISGDNLEKVGIVNVGDALAGKTSGVQIISDSGQPGAGVQIVVRGVGSNNNNGNNPIYIVDGMAVDGISYLSVYDIESMEVLKDAAAAAIYGARGGNGVIIVTTKKGKTGGRGTINYNFSYGISNIPRKLPVLNAREYAIIRNEMSVNGGGAPQFSDEQLNSFNRGTDWQEVILNRNAPTQQHNLSFAGGTDRSAYSLSASYLDQNGIIAKDKSNYKRYTVSFNGDQKFLRNDLLKVGQNIVFTRVINRDITSNSLMGGPITGALNMDPLTGVYDDYTQYDDYQDQQDYYDLFQGFAYSRYMNPDYTNPAALIHFSNPNSYWTTAKANIFAELTFLKDFKIRGSLGLDMTWTQTYSYTQPRRFNPSTVYNTENGTSQSSSERQTLNGETYLTWAKVIGKHDVTAMAGGQIIQRSGLSVSASRDGLLTTDPDRAYVSLGKGPNQGASGGPYDPSALVSFFARANYAYDNRYMISATFRYDGSSRFGINNKFATFPSVSIGWNIANESFLKDVREISALKLRVSWGQNGNDNIGNFSYLPTISTSSQLGYVFDGRNADAITPGGAPTRLANPNLKWETSEQFNVGVDLTLIYGLTFTLDYYIKTTKDLLVTSPIPLFFGTGFPTVNAGNVRNRGFEFMVDYKKVFGNGFYLNASANMSFNSNMVTYVGTDSGYVSGANINNIGEVTRMEEGRPMAYFRGLKVLGVFQNSDEINRHTWTNPDTGVSQLIQPDAVPGDLIFRDMDNNGLIDSQDRTMIGNPYPKMVYGININASWKNVDLTINTSGAAGFQVFSALRRVQAPNNWGKWALGRWTGEGTSNTIPRLTDKDDNANWNTPSELYIHDGDYFRIRNIALGYTFNINEKYYISKIRVFGSVGNVYTFTKYDRGYDPEIGAQNPLSVGIDLGNYPRPRTFSFGLNLTF